MLRCNENHKIILEASFSAPAGLFILYPHFENPRPNETGKFKRNFEQKKYTFARFKCSHVDQARRRKAGIGSSLPGILPGLCHETYLKY